MARLPPNAQPGRGLERVVAVWLDWLIRHQRGWIGARYAGLEVAPGAAHEDYARAFGRLGAKLQGIWWRDVFGEKMPPPGSTRWRIRLASLEMPPPAILLLETGAALLLEGGGYLRRS
jgi:hypothetical protein